MNADTDRLEQVRAATREQFLRNLEGELRSTVKEVADFQGMAFQDREWWPEVVALHRALTGETRTYEGRR